MNIPPTRLPLKTKCQSVCAHAKRSLSERVHAPVVTMPFSVGGTPDAKDLYGLFDDSIKRLLAVLK